jgi:formamidase
VPGFGFLRDEFPEPFLAHWHLVGRHYAESAQLPGVRIRYQPFPGILGLAPSRELREQAARREAELLERGGFVVPPGAAAAVPASGPIAERGLRTIPPRETGGNLDIKQLTPGVSVLLPVYVEGGRHRRPRAAPAAPARSSIICCSCPPRDVDRGPRS